MNDNFNNLIASYQIKDKNHIYYDKTLDYKGIDYQNYIRLWYDSINSDFIKSITINGWYILWYLMSNSQQTYYLKTTLQMISTDTNLNINEIKNTLNILQQQELIYLITDDKNKILKVTDNTIIEIIIVYNYNNRKNNNGYKGIPVEFVKTIIQSLKPGEWAVYTILLTRYSYWTPIQIKDDDIYTFRINHYAFPIQLQIADIIGKSKTTIRNYIKNLSKNKYKLIEIINDKAEGKFTNNRYRVFLLERIEYIYHNIINVPDNRDASIRKKIKKEGFEDIAKTQEQNILKDRDYLEHYFKNYINDYITILETQDINKYNQIKRDLTLTTW